MAAALAPPQAGKRQSLTRREEEQLKLYPECFAALLHGQWKPFVENFFWIDDKITRRMVPMRLTPNQNLLHQRVFEKLTHYTDRYRLVIPKDRQATLTSICQAFVMANVLNYPGLHSLYVFQDERTGRTLRRRNKNFLARMPRWFWRTDDVERRIEVDRDDYFEIGFYDHDGIQQGTSSMAIVSAGSEEFGAGLPPSLVIYDEYDLYENLSLVGRVNDGLHSSAQVIKLSTPRGMKQLHADYFAAKEEKSPETALPFYCFMNPANAIEEGSEAAPPLFRGDFDLLPEHEKIRSSAEWKEWSAFHGSMRETLGFFRWWEYQRDDIRRRLAAEGIYDEKRVLARIEREHMSSDRNCWRNDDPTPFDEDILEELSPRAQERRKLEDKAVAQGVHFIQWIEPHPGMAYACGMDCAEGSKLGDDIIAYIRDADGNYVAKIYKDGQCSLTAFTNATLDICEQYNGALFAPEVDGGLGLLAVEVAQERGYRNIWRRPKKDSEKEAHYLADRGKWGWRTQNNKEWMKQHGISQLNGKAVTFFDLDLIRDMTNFTVDEHRHTSDRLMAFFITEAITADHRLGRQYARLCAERPGSTAARSADLHGLSNRPKPRRQPVVAGPGVWR